MFTRTTSDFDPARPTGTLVCGADLYDTYGFCEHGYDADELDYEEPPVIWEVSTDVRKFVSLPKLAELCNQSGLRVFDTYEDYEAAAAQGYRGPAPGEDGFYCLEELALNQLLEIPAIQRIAEKAGYEAGRDYVAVSNTQPLLTIFWKPDSFRLEGPVAIEVLDPENPQHVALAGNAPRP